MTFQITWLDVAESLQTRQQPVVVIPRDAEVVSRTETSTASRGVHWVMQNADLNGSPDGDSVIDWVCVKSGRYVRVPVIAFKTPMLAASSILATGLEIGMRVVTSLYAYDVGNILKIHLVLGHTCDEVDGTYRVYIGVALHTSK